jgi:hypothetical protein
MCVVSDPGGVKSAALQFSDGVDGCNVNGAIYSGVFTLSPVPSPLFQALSGDAQGQVLDTLPLLASLQGPFSCEVPGVGVGVPTGESIRITCHGENWSQKPGKHGAQRTLTVALK